MEPHAELDAFLDLEVEKYTGGSASAVTQPVATEVPFTILANEIEVATLLCTPTELKALTFGFLFSSGLIRSAADVLACHIDSTRWVCHCRLQRPPDVDLLHKRVFTAGCGKGVMYAHVMEMADRSPLQSQLKISPQAINELAVWLQRSSALYKSTRGVHTAALSIEGASPVCTFDDIGRHNAVDKVIGHGLQHEIDFGRSILISSGRTSSDILQKTRRARIPICVSRSAPSHQAVLRARDTGVTIIGQARGNGFLVFSHGERIAAQPVSSASPHGTT